VIITSQDLKGIGKRLVKLISGHVWFIMNHACIKAGGSRTTKHGERHAATDPDDKTPFHIQQYIF
jgi:hypothetical protein